MNLIFQKQFTIMNHAMHLTNPFPISFNAKNGPSFTIAHAAPFCKCLIFFPRITLNTLFATTKLPRMHLLWTLSPPQLATSYGKILMESILILYLKCCIHRAESFTNQFWFMSLIHFSNTFIINIYTFSLINHNTIRHTTNNVTIIRSHVFTF